MDVETPAPVPERPHGVARVAAELGGTLVGTVGMGVAGAFVGGLVSASVCDSADLFRLQLPSSCFSGALLGGVVGAGVGVPLGVWWGGGKAGGNGRLAGALGGFGVSVASAGAAHLLGAEDLGVVLLATSPVLSILGYELTDSAPGALSPTEVTPTVSVSAGHATFGLQGRF